MDYYSAIGKKEILAYATIWTNLEDIMLNARSQIQRKIIYDSSYVKYLEEADS